MDTAARRLEELPTGGRTPLAEGLRAGDVLRLERIAIPGADRYWSSSPTGGRLMVQTRSPDRGSLPISSGVLMWRLW
jgi:hypothetical protein